MPPRPAVATDARRPSIRCPNRGLCSRSRPRSASALMLRPLFGIENVDLIFLTAIVGIAVRYGLWPSLAASVAASLAYNFFFLPPLYTFTIADPTNVAAFALFAALSFIVSNLAARGRMQAVAAHERVRTVESLYAFSRKLSGAGTLDDVLWATAHQIASMLKVRVVLLLPEDGSIAVKAGYPPEDRLEEGDLAAAKWAWEKDRPPGAIPMRCPAPSGCSCRCGRARGPIGIVGICQGRGGPAGACGAAAAAGCAERPGRAGDRARAPGGGHRARAADGGDGPPALGAADLDLARPEDAARCRDRRRGRAARPRAVARRGCQGRPARHHHRGIGAPQPLHRQPARHDQARVRAPWRRTSALHDVGEIVGSALERARSRSWRGTGWNSSSRPACRW